MECLTNLTKTVAVLCGVQSVLSALTTEASKLAIMMPLSPSVQTPGYVPKKPGGFFGYTHLKNQPQKTHTSTLT